MRIKNLLLTVLTVCLVGSGCGSPRWFDVPERPILPVSSWQISGDLYCTDEDGTRLLLEREVIRNSFELELKETIKACNKAVDDQISSWWNPFD